MVSKDNRSMKHYLSANTSVVRDKQLGAAVRKILNGHEAYRTVEEKEAVSALKSSPDIDYVDADLHLSYFENILTKRRMLSSSMSSYISCRFVPVTACSIKRLFSISRWILTVLPKIIPPILFENLLFLKLNCCL